MAIDNNLTVALAALCLLYASIVNADKLPTDSSTASPSVVSINLCTDQLALLLAEPGQILSLSNLSHDRSGSYLFEQARQYPANKGDSERIVALQPDLILAGEYTTRHTVDLLLELGFQVEVLPIAHTLEQLYDNVINVASWLGQPEKGQTLVSQLRERMESQQQALAGQQSPNPSAAYYDPNGYTVGRKTLRGLALELAGWTNVSAQWGIEHYGSMPLESMVGLAPDAIIDSPYSEGTYSRAQQVLQHPALRQRGLNPLVISIPSRQTICAGPWTVDMIEQLTAKRSEILKSTN